jgi:hypothetical protein
MATIFKVMPTGFDRGDKNGPWSIRYFKTKKEVQTFLNRHGMYAQVTKVYKRSR